MRDAGGGAPADIRQRVDQEARLSAGDDGFIDRLLYWRKSDTQKAVVDPDAGSEAAAAELRSRTVSGELATRRSSATRRRDGSRTCSPGCSRWLLPPALHADWRARPPSPARASVVFGCRCGQSLLIAGYEPRNFLGIAIQCAACGRISETPGLPQGAAPPAAVTLVERGAENPPATHRRRYGPDQPRGNGTSRRRSISRARRTPIRT